MVEPIEEERRLLMKNLCHTTVEEHFCDACTNGWALGPEEDNESNPCASCTVRPSNFDEHTDD